MLACMGVVCRFDFTNQVEYLLDRQSLFEGDFLTCNIFPLECQCNTYICIYIMCVCIKIR